MRKVLIVEPSTAEARALKEMIRDAKLANTSTVVKNGAEARRHLAERDQNCIVMLNIHAPDGDGMDLLAWLKEQSFYDELLVVALGERGQLRAVVEACERGAHTFVIKPIHVEHLNTLAERYPDYWARAH